MHGALIGAGKVLLLTALMLGLNLAGASLPAFRTMAAQMDPATGQGLLWGLALVALVDTLLLSWFILRAGAHGWPLALRVALLYYGAKTVMTQLEAWYFMTNITPEVLRGLFVMSIPAALLFPPMAVTIWGHWHAADAPGATLALPRSAGAWAWRVALLAAVVYPVLFFGFGYFVAWQNPEVRTFYGEPGAIQPFLAHMAATLAAAPGLYPFEVMRGLLWVGLALIVLTAWRGARWEAIWYVGLLFALLPNLGMILPNPLMPESVRLSHLIETISSNLLWGMAIAWLLTYRRAADIG
jgi:hypothetical protein